MTKLQLIKKRQEEGIKESKALFEMYNKKDSTEDDNLLAYHLLIEYLLDENYDLLTDLEKLNKKIKDDNDIVYYLLMHLYVDSFYRNEMHKKINYKYRSITDLKYIKTYIDEKEKIKMDKYILKSDKTSKDKAKLKLLMKAYKHSECYPAYLIGKFYQERQEYDHADYYFDISAKNGNKLAGLIMIDKYKDDKDKKLSYLKSIINKEDSEIILLMSKFYYEEKDYKQSFLYLLDNIELSPEIRYELAKFYEEGIFVEKNLMFAYFLYITCKNIGDSNSKIKEIKPQLMDSNLQKINELLEKDLIKEEKIRIQNEKKEEKKREEQKYYDFLISEFQRKVVLPSESRDNKDAWMYNNNGIYKKQYKEKIKYYEAALEALGPSSRFEYTKKAANKGHSKAMYALYELYEGIDDKLAIEWLNKAIKSGHKEALRKLNQIERLEKKKDKEEKDNYLKELKNNPSKIKELLVQADKDNKEAIHTINDFFGEGPLLKKILNVFHEESNAGNDFASYFLYEYYIKENDTFVLALEHLEKCCSRGFVKGIKKYVNYSSSDIFKRDKKVLKQILDMETDDMDIVIGQACILKSNELSSENLSPNYDLAFEKLKYLENKYNAKNRNLYVNIAQCYEYGQGVEKDIKKAIEYYKAVDCYRAVELEEELRIKKSPKEPYIVNKVPYETPKPKVDPLKEKELKEKEAKEKLQRERLARLEKEAKELGKEATALKSAIMEAEKVLAAKKTTTVKTTPTATSSKTSAASSVTSMPKSTNSVTPKATPNKIEVKTTVDPSKATPNKIEVKTTVDPSKASVSKTSVQTTQTNTSAVKNSISMSEDDPYYKDTARFAKTGIGLREARLVAILRKKLNYPLEPNMLPEVDKYGIRHSKREREKTYIKELEERKSKLDEYYERLYALDNKLKANFAEYRKKVWHLSDDVTRLTGDKFAKKCEDAYNSKFKSHEDYKKITIKTSGYKYADTEGGKINSVEAIERLMVNLPNYAYEIKIIVRGIITYQKNYDDPLYDELIDFENSKLSKVMSWNDYTKYEDVASRVHHYTYIDTSERRDANSRALAERNRETNIKKFIIDMFEQHNVFAGTYTYSKGKKEQYYEGLVRKIKFEFHWKEKN